MTKEPKKDEVTVMNVFIAEPRPERQIVNYNENLTEEENALVQKQCDILTGYEPVANSGKNKDLKTDDFYTKINDLSFQISFFCNFS